MKDPYFDFLKIGYLVKHFADYSLVPRWFHRMRRNVILRRLSSSEQQNLDHRIAYYNRLKDDTPIDGGKKVVDYRFPFKEKRRFTTYFFDLYDVVKHFGKDNRFFVIPGDVTHVPDVPTFVKSRPIADDESNANSVLLKLNKLRHFTLIRHDKPFAEKKDMLVGRTAWANASPQRRRLYELYGNHPLCDVGKTRREDSSDKPYTIKPYLSRRQQLEYKFIASIEGNDVATNLKWIMSSNSVAISPPLHYETWFMEGQLVPNYHYIEVKPDFSDLIEKLEYYIAHPAEAETIVAHAHDYIRQFTNKRMERAVQLAVADKYFKLTNV